MSVVIDAIIVGVVIPCQMVGVIIPTLNLFLKIYNNRKEFKWSYLINVLISLLFVSSIAILTAKTFISFVSGDTILTAILVFVYTIVFIGIILDYASYKNCEMEIDKKYEELINNESKNENKVNEKYDEDQTRLNIINDILENNDIEASIALSLSNLFLELGLKCEEKEGDKYGYYFDK